MLSTTHSLPPLDSKASRSPKAANPQAKEKAEGSAGAPGGSGKEAPGPSRAPFVPGMKPGEARLAGYLMARAALHRKIEGQVLGNLRAGHETMQEVGALLPLGRSNVREDIQKPGNEGSALRHHAALRMQESLESMQGYSFWRSMPDEEHSPMAAATSQYAKTGTCYSYATNTTILHAAKLAGMPEGRAIVAQAEQPKIDHVWSEMIPEGKGKYGKPRLRDEDVIMDGWCEENVAILREDSAFARLDEQGRGSHLSHEHLLDPRSGPVAMAKLEAFKARIEASETLQQRFHTDLNSLAASGFELKHPWDSLSVFHPEFRRQAGAAMHPEGGHPAAELAARIPGADPASIRAKHASLAGIQAIGVARSLGADIRGAKAEAPAILAAAKEMFPRPEPENGTLLSRLSAYLRS
jgi:hypothetical protein